MIRLERTHLQGMSAYLLVSEDRRGDSLLVQVDYDYPSIASTFGWSPAMVREDIHGSLIRDTDGTPCEHDGTDGTIPCQSCGTSATTFIDAAAEWLDDHIGATADDPGYFTED